MKDWMKDDMPQFGESERQKASTFGFVCGIAAGMALGGAFVTLTDYLSHILVSTSRAIVIGEAVLLGMAGVAGVVFLIGKRRLRG